jgi:hypothetical protein
MGDYSASDAMGRAARMRHLWRSVTNRRSGEGFAGIAMFVNSSAFRSIISLSTVSRLSQICTESPSRIRRTSTAAGKTGTGAASYYGGSIANPLVQDIQQPEIFEEIYQKMKRRTSRTTDFQMRRDAEHLAQAISNVCDVFLTRDYKTIIGPMREWLEEKYPSLRIRLPSELVAEL